MLNSSHPIVILR